MANGFGQKLQGLLGDPLLNLGVGLLSAGGPSLTPVSIGSGLASALQFTSERERAALENKAMREALLANQRQSAAREQLQGLLGQSSVVQGPGTQVTSADPLGVNVNVPGRQGLLPTVSTPQGQQQLMGLLAEANPQAFSDRLTEGLLGSMFSQQAAPEFQSPVGKMLGDLETAEQTGNDFAANQLRQAIEGELGGEADLSEVRSVRNDVIRQSETFLLAQQGFNRVTTGAQAGTPAGDLAVTFGIMKLFDPTSAVREGEQATIRNAGGVPERIRNMYNRIVSGETLTPEQRQDFVNQARAQFEKVVEQQQRVITDARGFAQRNSLPLLDVVPEFVVPPQSLPEVSIQREPPAPRRTLEQPLTPKERQELQRLREALGIPALGGGNG